MTSPRRGGVSEGDVQKGLLSTEEAAAYLGVSPRLVRKLAAERRIQFCRVGRLVRFTQSHLDKYVAGRTVEVLA